MTTAKLVLFSALSITLASPQTTSPNRPFVRATGEASVSLRPDQVRVAVGVITQASTAQQAASQNAERAAAVIHALRQLLGPSSEIRTFNYNVAPNYVHGRDGVEPKIVGFTASNTVEAATSDISLTGRVIDSAIQAGANRVEHIRFGVKNDDAAKNQALRLAAQRAREKANAMAGGLGVRLGSVLRAEEGAAVRPLAFERAAMASTPIEPGMLEVSAAVTIDWEILQ